MLLLKTEKPRHKEGQILPSVVQWTRRSQVLYAPGQCFIPVPQPRPLSSVMGEAQKLWVLATSALKRGAWGWRGETRLWEEMSNHAARPICSPCHLTGCNNHKLGNL